MSTPRECGCLGKGRHRNDCPAKTATPAPEYQTGTAVVMDAPPEPYTIPDDELENYGGDLAALDSWSPRARTPFASWRDYAPSGSVLPDLNPKGMLVFKHAPEKNFHFTYLEEDGSPHSRQAYMTMNRRGFKPVTADDFVVHPTLRDIFVFEDGTGRLTLAAAKGAVTVVYAQGEADYRKYRDLMLKQSNEIQKTAEEKVAELQESARSGGFHSVTSSSRMEDDIEAASIYRR